MALRSAVDPMVRFAHLEAENDELRERIRQLEGLISLGKEMPAELRLSRMESKFLGLLYRRDIASKEAVMMVLYGHMISPPDDKVLNVFILRMRRKLASRGITIENLWGQGWTLPPGSKAIIKSLLSNNGDRNCVNL